MSQNWRIPQGAEHVDAPCVVLHGGREVAPSSTARGRQLRSRPARRLASTATKTVARRGMSDALQSERRVQSDASCWYHIFYPDLYKMCVARRKHTRTNKRLKNQDHGEPCLRPGCG